MSESLVFKQLRPSGRPTYRKSNSFNKMPKSKRSTNDSGSSRSNISLQYCNDDDDDSIDNSVEFNSNGITTASTPFAPKAASFSGYPNEELQELKLLSNDLERSWSMCSKTNTKNEKQPKVLTPKCTNNSSQTSNFYENYKIVLLTILIILIGLIPLFNNTYQKSNINIKELKEKFPNQPKETWLYFETIIDDILLIHPTHPAVFLLLYTTENNEVSTLIHHLGKYASAKLETNNDYIYVNKNEFHSEEVVKDYGFLIHKYEQDLIKKKVMIVEDLQEISGKVAQAFHTLCDEITPLVDKVVYIFTLKVDSLDGKEEKIAETYLKRFWNDLDNDILMPLITRVTSTVIKIVN